MSDKQATTYSYFTVKLQLVAILTLNLFFLQKQSFFDSGLKIFHTYFNLCNYYKKEKSPKKLKKLHNYMFQSEPFKVSLYTICRMDFLHYNNFT